ncbi:MAG: hypothetical protein HW377_2427, partial [Actinobacteria bacterium]|nr:hypothetical protein [Actinomycetota bacterium]
MATSRNDSSAGSGRGIRKGDDATVRPLGTTKFSSMASSKILRCNIFPHENTPNDCIVSSMNRKSAAKPPTTIEEKETVRRQIRAILEKGPHTAIEISFAIRKPEK